MDIDKSVIARFKKEGKDFEILVDCDKAIAFKGGKEIPIDEVLVTNDIFVDVKKGTHAPEKDLENIFKTDDKTEIAKVIINKGEIQLTTDYKNKIREEKRKRIIDLIHRNTVDSKTGLPHPLQRIDSAMEEAKVNIDFYKSSEEQFKEVIKEIRAIIPIKIEKREIKIRIPVSFVGKSHGAVRSFGELLSENYDSDGSYIVVIEIPSGIQEELFDKINSLTQGQAEIDIIKIKE